MDYVKLGRTELSVSVAGLGCGGHSRLGQSQGATKGASVDLVRGALDLGINFIDTAAAYGTEEIVGQAIRDSRDKVVLSSKTIITTPEKSSVDLINAAQLRANLEQSLKTLRTDYIDVFHLHAVALSQYDHCCAELVPELLRLRDEGKIRFLGITERFIQDTTHMMLDVALRDDIWDVMMVGFNLLNPGARATVFPLTQDKQIATLIMFAVRRALSNPGALVDLIRELSDSGLIDPDILDPADPLGFLRDNGSATSAANAAYRFCRHEPGVDVVLTGTGNLTHLQENAASICQGPLRPESREKLKNLFGAIDSVSGN